MKEIAMKEIANVLNDLNIYELENIKRNLSSLIKTEDKMSFFQNNSSFESNFREYYKIEEIERYIEIGIINFGAYNIYDLVVSLLEERKRKHITIKW